MPVDANVGQKAWFEEMDDDRQIDYLSDAHR